MRHNIKNAAPEFSSFACVGDTTVWAKDGFVLTATLEADDVGSPRDFDCYSPEDIERWDKGDWQFVGVAVSATFNGVELEGSTSLWCVDCNFSDTSNAYLGEVCRELEDDAVRQGREDIERMLRALTGPTVTDDFGNLV